MKLHSKTALGCVYVHTCAAYPHTVGENQYFNRPRPNSIGWAVL